MATAVLDIERELRVGAAEARTAMLRFLRAQEFTITTEQVSMVSAKRGSQILGSVQARKLPVTAMATFQPSASGCTLSVHIADAWRSPAGKVWGMNGPYRTLLGELQTALESAIRPLLAPDAVQAAAAVVTTTKDVPLLSLANSGAVKGGGAIADKIDAALTPDGPQITSKKLEEVVLRSSKGVASFDRNAAEGLFTVGLMVSTKPGSMPVNLARDVEALSAKLESRLAAQPEGRVVCELEDQEIPVAEFLAKQAAIRTSLPLRTLHVCTTCKFEKTVNPDFEKLKEKNRRKQALTGAVGATVSTRGISPFILVGSLFRLKNFDIQFVCPRCQGLDADSSVVTFCPNCGERRDEAVLRTCRRCQHNFGAAAPTGELWDPDVAALSAGPPPPAALLAGAPAPAALPAPFAAPVAALPAPAALTPPPPPQPAVPPPRPADWHPDPTGRHQHRYWDGTRWTAHVADQGTASTDPLDQAT